MDSRSKVCDERTPMASSWERRDAEKEERLYNALGAALNRLIDTAGASNAVIAQACGEFYAQVCAALSVENGETPEQPAMQHRAISKLARKTNHIERFNNTLRQRVSRLVRDALSFSKKLANHIGAINLFICRYNLTRAAA